MRVSFRTPPFAALCALLALCAPAVAQSGPVVVTIDGTPVGSDQPPIERAGRVFVPLRGVFEKLGASVVYDHGHMNATKGPTTISLTVGTTAALVNGRQQYLDNPPFVIGARVLVPLRFVSQALGTTVNFIRATRTVAISVPAVRGLPRRTLDMSTSGVLMNLSPGDNATAPPQLAQITGAFVRDVDPKSVHAMLDGTDITPEIFVTSRTFVYYVVTPLNPGRHTVTLSGNAATGQPIHGGWSFATT